MGLGVLPLGDKTPHLRVTVLQCKSLTRPLIPWKDIGFGRPGIFEIEIHDVGHVAAYREWRFLGALRWNRLVRKRLDALSCGPVAKGFKIPIERLYRGVEAAM